MAPRLGGDLMGLLSMEKGALTSRTRGRLHVCCIFLEQLITIDVALKSVPDGTWFMRQSLTFQVLGSGWSVIGASEFSAGTKRNSWDLVTMM